MQQTTSRNLNVDTRVVASDSAVQVYAPAHHGFAWLRMIGSLLVIVEHSSPMVGNGNSVFPEHWIYMPGYAGLLAFFAMSGFQIAESWANEPVAWRFALKRILRLWPPLLTVVLLTVFVIGPLSTIHPIREYFADPQTLRYFLYNSTLVNLQHVLPGVFAHNPYPWSANGSLWTLPMELVGYIIVLCLGLVGVLRRRPAIVVGLLIMFVAFDRRFQAAPGDPGGGGSILGVPIGALCAFMVPFLIGSLLCVWRSRVPLIPAVALGMLALQIAVHLTPVGPFWLGITSSYGAITLAHHWPRQLVVPGRWVYGSYGTYVWGFPVQQILIQAAGIRNQWLLMLTSVPLAYMMGFASWTLIEAPALRWRGLLLRERKPTPATTTAPTTAAIA